NTGVPPAPRSMPTRPEVVHAGTAIMPTGASAASAASAVDAVSPPACRRHPARRALTVLRDALLGARRRGVGGPGRWHPGDGRRTLPHREHADALREHAGRVGLEECGAAGRGIGAAAAAGQRFDGERLALLDEHAARE